MVSLVKTVSLVEAQELSFFRSKNGGYLLYQSSIDIHAGIFKYKFAKIIYGEKISTRTEHYVIPHTKKMLNTPDYKQTTKPQATDKIILYNLKRDDENESLLRRFEIIFFISLPVSTGLSLAGLLGYRTISGRNGSFSGAEYMYLALSSTGISLSIAFNDYLKTKRKPG